FSHKRTGRKVVVSVVTPRDYVAPDVEFETPPAGTVFAPGSDIQVAVHASSPLRIDTLRILLETNLVAQAETNRLTVTLTNIPPATYGLNGIAEDQYGISVTNGPVNFRINSPPIVSLFNQRGGFLIRSGE